MTITNQPTWALRNDVLNIMDALPSEARSMGQTYLKNGTSQEVFGFKDMTWKNIQVVKDVPELLSQEHLIKRLQVTKSKPSVVFLII